MYANGDLITENSRALTISDYCSDKIEIMWSLRRYRVLYLEVCRREKINTVVGIGKGVTFQARTWCVASQSKSSYVSTDLAAAGAPSAERRAPHTLRAVFSTTL